MKNLFWISTLSLGLCAGCSKPEGDQVIEAQNCLDNLRASESAQALACMDKVTGLETEGAYLIRCSANFIYQDFANPTRLAKISDQMKNSGSSAATTAIGLLAFTKPTTAGAGTLASSTLDYCIKAKSKGMVLLAAMTQIATVANIAGVGAIATDCDATAPGYNATTCQTTTKTQVCSMDSATLGSATLSAYQQSCLGSSQQNSSVCAQFAAAASGQTNAATIGSTMKSQMSCP